MERKIAPTRAERRKTQLDEVRAFAADNGMELDVSDKASVKDALITMMEMMELDPEILQGNGQILSQCVDANGYVRGRTGIRSDIKVMRAEMVRLVRLHAAGGPRQPGDLSNLEISTCARRILEGHLGCDWQATITKSIQEQYEKSLGFKKSYAKLDDKVGFKLAQGRILVQAALGTAYYRNGHLIMSGVELPKSTMIGIIGKDASQLMEGNPYGNAFHGVPVRHAECPERTTIIHLEEEYEPAGPRNEN